MLEEKDFLKKLKLMFATIFARSMPKIIVGCPELADNVFIYSNVPLEDMEYFEPDANYYFHKVEILDTEFLETLISKFTIFKTATFMLYADKFLAALGKHVGSLDTISLTADNIDILITVHQKDESELTVKCGEIISAYTASRYNQVFDEYKVDPITSKKYDILDDLQKGTPISIIELPLNDHMVKCALLNNGSGVSIKEFPSKADLFEYSYCAITSASGKTLRVNIFFASPIVRVTSVQPATVWFTQTKKG